MKTKKQKAQADKDQPSLYGDVDELYNLLSAHESADKEAVDTARKRVTNAEENLAEANAQLDNTQRAMSIVERRLEELKPKGKKKEVTVGAVVGMTVKDKKEKPSKKKKKKEEAAQRKARLTGKRDKPEGKPSEATPPPPQKNVKKKK